MTEDQLELLLKARQSLSAAKVLLDNGFPDYATSRAYEERQRADEALTQLEQERQRYQALEALLLERGINPKQL